MSKKFLELIAKHRRHVELSLGAGESECRYAIAVLDDLEADVRRMPETPGGEFHMEYIDADHVRLTPMISGSTGGTDNG